MAKTFLDELVEYPAKAIQKLGEAKDVLALLSDNEDIDITSDEAEETMEKYIHDYVYVDNTVTEARAYVCVEAELIKTPTPTIQDLRLFVTVFCHNEYMKLDGKRFPSVVGNRRDNIVREVDKILNGAEAFGLGVLTLNNVKTVGAPSGFTAREITYFVSDFRNKGVTRIAV